MITKTKAARHSLAMYLLPMYYGHCTMYSIAIVMARLVARSQKPPQKQEPNSYWSDHTRASPL